MEKGKKDKKSRSDKKGDVDNGDVLDHVIPTTKASKKKEKKKKQVEDTDSEDDDVSDQNVGTVSRFGFLDVEEKSENETESEPETKQQSKSSQRKTKKQAKTNAVDVAEENGVEDMSKQEKKQTKKKGKKATKGAGEEEDIDAILAELSLKSSEPVKKKGGKHKSAENMDEEPSETVPESVKGSITLENRPLTQDEIGKVMEEMYPDSSDEDKKKKKKNKKQRDADGGKEGKVEENDGHGGTEKSDKSKAKQATKKSANQKPIADENILNEKNSEAADKSAGNQAVEPKLKQSSKQTKQSSVEAAEKRDEKAQETTVNADLSEKPQATSTAPDNEEKEGDDEEAGKKSKKDKRKRKDIDKKKKEEDTKEKKPPQSKLAQKILEQQRLIKEEEERLRREEEERIRRIEEAERLQEEKERLERERKERKKMKKKEAKDRQIAEGTYMTAKERAKKAIALAKLEVLQKQGAEIPALSVADGVEIKKPRVVYGLKKKKPSQTQSEQQGAEKPTETELPTATVERQSSETTDVTADVQPMEVEPVVEKEEEVKEAWDATSEEEDEEEGTKPSVSASKTKLQSSEKSESGSKSEEDESESDDEDSSSEEESDSEEESSDEEKSPQEKAREKALARIKARKEEAQAKRSVDVLRAPVVCVLGHVDTGKTKILDKLRRTNVQDGEAGGITQQIGATNVPQETIREQTKMCKDFSKVELKLPGLLIIDTPGHESFSNLRNRGSSLCDIAILVVDIMHGLEPQTKESIELLKSKKTPFVVALNKVDRLNEWQTSPHTDVVTTISKQKQSTKLHFEDRVKHIIVEFAEVGLNVALFHQNKDLDEYISMVPTSAHSGDGMGNLIAQICEQAQTMLTKRLSYLDDLQATVMEVKAIPGHGTTIDVILVNGCVHEGDTIIVAGQEGPIVTQIRALMMPQPLRELRVKNEYIRHKEVKAAQGCKIAASNLEKALAGLPMFVAHFPDEIDIYKEELAQMLADVLGSIKVQERGVFVQASTLGSLEALLVFLTSSKIPYAGISIGPIHKRDVMKASVMLEHDPQYAVILAFDVKVERDAQEMADSVGVRIFVADIIYHLFDQFTKYREDWLRKKQEENKHLAVFPCKLRIYPQNVFKSRDPIVVGVNVEAGFLKQGTMICVPSKEFIELGRVSSIESNHKPVDKAARGQDVCIKIDPIPGEAPKMYGRHFDSADILVSKISRETIDVVKNYFRDEMTKADWQLVMELKKTFAIM